MGASGTGYDFDLVTPRLLTGAAPPDEGFIEALAEAGVSHILDVTDEHDDTSLLATHPSIVYCYNPIADDGEPKPISWFAKSLSFGLPMFALPKAKLYTHCTMGINRGPSSAYVVMRALGWADQEALEAIKLARSQARVRYAPDADAAIAALGYQ